MTVSSASVSDPIIRLGTRHSPLAMAQAEEARARLCVAHGWEESAVELVPVEASGDKVLDRPLAEIGGKALWTKELDQWLAEGEIDAAVHSMKDVETLRPDTLAIAAVLERADERDCLIGAAAIDAIPSGARFGTSSPRRAAQMLNLRPDLEIVPMRGNVATRLAKLEQGECDVTMLAAAGLERLGMAGIGTPLDPQSWLPCASQGAIGVECRAGDTKTRKLFDVIDHAPSRVRVMAERAVLEGLGGSCNSPVAIRSMREGIRVRVNISLFSADGSERVDGEAIPLAGNWEVARKYAANLISGAPEPIRSLFTQPDTKSKDVWTSDSRGRLR